MWKIMAGRGSEFLLDFISHSVVGIGWSDAGDYRNIRDREELQAIFSSTYPDSTPRQIQVAAGQAFRFLREIRNGDSVLAYDPGRRIYHVGTIEGEPDYRVDWIERLPIVRRTTWSEELSRDALSPQTRNSLGAILTIFRVPPAAELEIRQKLGQAASIVPDAERADGASEGPSTPEDLRAIALERLKDRLLAMEWDTLQDVVAALLRGMGYRTIVSSAGPDRGRDVLASRDGFGFEPPRIVVEVKHRRGAMGAPDIRAFLGGRHPQDRGLFVSTGGFSREANYEADRANTPTHLMDLDGLARAIIDRYGDFDREGAALLPMARIYWPI